MERKEYIINIYSQYPYTFEKDGGDYLIFSYEEGIYPAVDIIVKDTLTEEEQNKIKQEYSIAGFATRLIKYNEIDVLEDYLFKNFFSPALAKQKLLSEYALYAKKVMSPYIKEDQTIPEYTYINVDYRLEKNFSKETNVQVDVIKKLYNIMLDNEGASLIIVEAPAGFGKTSTSYELVKTLCSDERNIRPFFMKLEKDRQATTFRYLLLSQIDRNFKVKHKNDIVLRHIKNGRIPLIIDGFDELLSKDLDKGEQKIGFEKVETMLSTIGELLTDKSKIILTSRKTAIFSGEQFMEWYYNQLDKGKNFNLYRFQLEVPSINDWLPYDTIKKLPKSLLKVTNPVLLSYLRYASDVDYNKMSNSLNLVEAYFTFLFQREQIRQNLLLKVPEQHKIFEKLAAYFAAFDVTSIPRKEVSEAIYEVERGLIEKYSENKEKEKNLINKLTNHAILDRHENGNIGFINDFIYGTLLGQALLDLLKSNNNSLPLSLITTLTPSTMDKIIEATNLWKKRDKKELADALLRIPNLSPNTLFTIDWNLKGEISRKYEYLSFNQENFKGIKITENAELFKCTFSDCSFQNSELDFDKIKECYFINCKFEKTIISGNKELSYFYELKKDDNKISGEDTDVLLKTVDDLRLDKLILSHYFRKGTVQARPYRISVLVKNIIDTYDRKEVVRRLEWMQSKRYIHASGDISWLLKEGSDYYNSLI